jgi:large subunit ribosomal protein L9
MKILLRGDIKGVGRRGDVVNVKKGFARNFLLPTGAGIVATESLASQAKAMRRSRDLKDSQNKQAAETQCAAIESAVINVVARAGASGRLFGSITEVDVAAAISSATGVTVDRHQIAMAEHLKQLGEATVVVQLFGDVIATARIEVVAKS